jgi:DUF4097 and DUF4098 domain-containing protein YvlB
MKRMLPAAVVTTLLAAGSLWAQVPVNEHRDVKPDALIEVELVTGTIHVTGWDKAEVEVTGTLGDDRQKLEITGGKDRLKIEVELPEGKHHDIGGSDLEIHVPKGCGVNVETVSAPIIVTGMTARVKLESVSGKLQVEESPREVKLSTVSGEIVIEDGTELQVAEVNSVSGSIEASLSFRSGGSFSFETVSGPIILRLPAGINADFNVSTFSGSITNDFGEKPTRKSTYLPAQELEFTAGSGGARVTINAFSGPVKILKK